MNIQIGLCFTHKRKSYSVTRHVSGHKWKVLVTYPNGSAHVVEMSQKKIRSLLARSEPLPPAVAKPKPNRSAVPHRKDSSLRILATRQFPAPQLPLQPALVPATT